jgi:hypothetical protein
MTKTQGFGLLLAAAVQAAAAAPVAPAGATPTGIRTMKGVTPEVLRIQDQVNKKEWCAHVVEVLDGKEACKTHQCARPFDYGEASKTGLKKGMRAIELAACDASTPGGEMLLWGPANLMLLNTDRPLESGLWEQVTSKKGKSIKFPTEASDGTLSLKGGKFSWTESEE